MQSKPGDWRRAGLIARLPQPDEGNMTGELNRRFILAPLAIVALLGGCVSAQTYDA